jgi:glutathione S-transferase
MSLDGSTLTYFAGAGRAEVLRLSLAKLGVQWTDERLDFKSWPAFKASAPWGTVPTLKLADGQVLAQTKAILRLVGKKGGFYPTDELLAMRADELVDALEDLSSTVRLTGSKLEGAEKEAARKASSEAGEIYAALEKIEAFVGAHGSDGFAVGSSLSIADFALFATLSNLAGGNYDGVPPTVLDPFRHVQAVRKTVASLPTTVAWYESRGDAKSKFEIFNASAKDLVL